MTKKFNKGSNNQNSPQAAQLLLHQFQEFVSGDNSKGNKRNIKEKTSKTKGKN